MLKVNDMRNRCGMRENVRRYGENEGYEGVATL